MSFTKYCQLFSSGNIFLIPIDDEYNQNNRSFPDYNQINIHFPLSQESSPSNTNISFNSFSDILEIRKLQTENIFKGNLFQKIQTFKTKVKEDYINMLISNYHRDNKIFFSNSERY